MTSRFRLTAMATVVTLAAGALSACGGDKTAAPQGRNGQVTAAPSAGAASPGPSATGGAPSTSPSPSLPGLPPPGARAPRPNPRTPPARVPVISRIDTSDRVVFVTIDDGWVKDPRFLRQVRDRRVPLTVFLTNDAITGDYGYFRRLQQLGAVIENHTLTHPVLSRRSAGRQRREICETQNIYAARFGARPALLRPPYGEFNKTTREVAASCGLKAIVNWTAEYKSETGRMEYQRSGGLRPGDIILWHFNPGMPRNFDRLLRLIRKQGFRPAPLKDYLGLD